MLPGIFACGNVLQVHDLVDYVSAEAERAGIGAVRYINSFGSGNLGIETKAGNGVRYVLPQKIRNISENVELFLRVTQPFSQVKFTVSDETKVLTSVKRLKAAPGEMEKITLKPEMLRDITGPITVNLEVL